MESPDVSDYSSDGSEPEEVIQEVKVPKNKKEEELLKKARNEQRLANLAKAREKKKALAEERRNQTKALDKPLKEGIKKQLKATVEVEEEEEEEEPVKLKVKPKKEKKPIKQYEVKELPAHLEKVRPPKIRKPKPIEYEEENVYEEDPHFARVNEVARIIFN